MRVTFITDLATRRRFWSRVAVGGRNQCWEWQGKRQWRAYGSFSAHIVGTRYVRGISPHRFAFLLAYGSIGGSGGLVCHGCSNPPCCNPTHLYEGNHARNADDARRVCRFRRDLRQGMRQWREGRAA